MTRDDMTSALLAHLALWDRAALVRFVQEVRSDDYAEMSDEELQEQYNAVIVKGMSQL